MRLDRFSGQAPKYRVLRRLDETPAQKDEVEILERYGHAYREVEPYECFVLKRGDINAPAAIKAYAESVLSTSGDIQYYNDLMRMCTFFSNVNLMRNPD